MKVDEAQCSCPKGLGEGCSHIAADMYSIVHVKRWDSDGMTHDTRLLSSTLGIKVVVILYLPHYIMPINDVKMYVLLILTTI